MKELHPSLIVGRNVIEAEVNALHALSAAMGESFVVAVETVLNMHGRLVVTGVGKSGHISRKISSTFASTGTPSLYVHPAEASHGDLGMIAADDVVLALSKSGESPELGDIVSYCRRRGVPIIVICARRESSLARAASCLLLIPDLPEASPLGVAPTTSTTMSLAAGDALALAVLDRRDFSKSQFRELHPGGKLGQKLMRVRDIMHTEGDLPVVCSGASAGDAILEMTRTRFGCVGIVSDDGQLIGIFTDGDLRRNFSASTFDQVIDTLMIHKPLEIDPDALIEDVAHLFTVKRIPSVFATVDHRPVGIVHVHDLLGRNLI